MTEESTAGTQRTRDDNRDEVQETWYTDQMDVKVEKVIRSGMEEDQKLLKVYAKRRATYGRLDGEGTEEVSQFTKIGEFQPQTATEVLFGLAESHGYNLEAK
jgi:hypothetical protein